MSFLQGKLKPLDIAAMGLALAAILFSAFTAWGSGSSRPRVVIEGRDGSWIYPLSSELNLEIEGPLGKSVVVLHGGMVHIETSPCENQTCVAAGGISRKGEWLACLPNKVLVRIEGTEEEIDASTW